MRALCNLPTDLLHKTACFLEILRQLIDGTNPLGFPHLEMSCNKSKRIDRIRGFPSSTFLLKFFPNIIPESPPILSSPWNSWGSCLVPACQEATFFPLSLIPSNSLILIFCFSLHNFTHIFTFSHHYFIIRPLIYQVPRSSIEQVQISISSIFFPSAIYLQPNQPRTRDRQFPRGTPTHPTTAKSCALRHSDHLLLPTPTLKDPGEPHPIGPLKSAPGTQAMNGSFP